ncbi:hypothetical protein [Pyxidicoccus xibeiensis]|uniref:hypothetical protein n=1 Tax=Pyxidicoccus xibeiensis TaxID=2906759 RepID=UPI0020A7AFB1|nr:hypothetical protein [Pyxidicoccus xibeiensis]MCP3144585.1 hypothetical protein [Pyxidicoccus xibeiensis]
MARFIRRNLGLLCGAFVLVAAPVAANTMQLFTDFKLTHLIPGLEPRPEQKVTPVIVIVIERERITLPVNSQQVVEGSGIHAVPAATAPGDGIRTVGEHAYEIPHGEMQAALSRMDDLSTQARIVPAFREGQAQGFKLFAIRPGSVFAKLGLVNGDVLQRINGLSLQTPEGAMAAFQNLREARHFELDLERDGGPVRKVYDVR